jgi:hypothetical protein
MNYEQVERLLELCEEICPSKEWAEMCPWDNPSTPHEQLLALTGRLYDGLCWGNWPK